MEWNILGKPWSELNDDDDEYDEDDDDDDDDEDDDDDSTILIHSSFSNADRKNCLRNELS